MWMNDARGNVGVLICDAHARLCVGDVCVIR